jgi:hypothetical protein
VLTPYFTIAASFFSAASLDEPRVLWRHQTVNTTADFRAELVLLSVQKQALPESSPVSHSCTFLAAVECQGRAFHSLGRRQRQD